MNIPLSVCVPLSFKTIPFFSQEHTEDVESKEAKEEADDDKGRPNGVQSSIRTPLAVTIHGLFKGCVSVMLCLFWGKKPLSNFIDPVS